MIWGIIGGRSGLAVGVEKWASTGADGRVN